MSHSAAIVVTRRGGLVRSLFIIIKTFALGFSSHFEASSPSRIQSPYIPRRTVVKTSTGLYRTRFYKIRGVGESPAIVDEPLRSKCKYPQGQALEELLTRFLG